jgi:hypothetical protein
VKLLSNPNAPLTGPIDDVPVWFRGLRIIYGKGFKYQKAEGEVPPHIETANVRPVLKKLWANDWDMT